MIDAPVTWNAHDGICVMTFARPRKRNAIDANTSQVMVQLLERFESSRDLRVGIITGDGHAFSSGVDLASIAAGEAVGIPGRGLAGITEKPPSKPVIAAVEGCAVGGGMEVALACDLIVAGRTAIFSLPEVGLGRIAGAGGLMRLHRRVSLNRAMDLAMTGRRIDAETASSWGLIDRLTEPGSALTEALALAQEIARQAPMAVRATKRILLESATWRPDEAFDRQQPIRDRIYGSAEAAEGAAAFMEKREPQWEI